jgi:hypothetical protein
MGAGSEQRGRTSYNFNTWFKESAVDRMGSKANALASAFFFFFFFFFLFCNRFSGSLTVAINEWRPS